MLSHINSLDFFDVNARTVRSTFYKDLYPLGCGFIVSFSVGTGVKPQQSNRV